MAYFKYIERALKKRIMYFQTVQFALFVRYETDKGCDKINSGNVTLQKSPGS